MEIQAIWLKPLTGTSIIFLLNRYLWWGVLVCNIISIMPGTRNNARQVSADVWNCDQYADLVSYSCSAMNIAVSVTLNAAMMTSMGVFFISLVRHELPNLHGASIVRPSRLRHVWSEQSTSRNLQRFYCRKTCRRYLGRCSI